MHQNLLDELKDDDFDAVDEQAETSAVEDEYEKPVAIRMGRIGIGQAGCNMAMIDYLLGSRSVFLINTAESDLESIKHPIPKLPISKQGTAKDRELGRKFAQQRAMEIRNKMDRVFESNVEKVVIYLSLGGGTGSGAGPEVIRIAKEYILERGGNPKSDIIVVQVLPTPSIDGDKPCFNALKAYGEIDRLGVATVTIDNSKLLKVRKPKLGNFWGRMNYWVVHTLHQFNVYARIPTEIGQFDAREFNDILNQGRFMYTMFKVKSLGDQYTIGEEMCNHLKRSVFVDTELGSAKKAACILALNRNTVTDRHLSSITTAFEDLNRLMAPGSTLHQGMYLEDFETNAPADEPSDLYGYVMLGGLGHPMDTLERIFERAKDFSQEYGSVNAFLTS